MRDKFSNGSHLDYLNLTAIVFLSYLLASVLFSALLLPSYWAEPGSFTGDVPPSMGPAAAIFCLALGTIAQTAVGLSDLAPATPYTVTVIVCAHFTGLLMGAVLLGVLLNKASIPAARVVFSDVALLTSRNREPKLVFRIGNTRGNFLLAPEIRIGYMRVQHTEEGESVVQMERMEFSEPPAMSPCINIACTIAEGSPLWGKTYADLKREAAAIYVSLTAVDNQHYQQVYARKYYTVKDMRVNCHFADVLKVDGSGQRSVDFRSFNTVVANSCMPLSFGLTQQEIERINRCDVAPAATAGSEGDDSAGVDDEDVLEMGDDSGGCRRREQKQQAASPPVCRMGNGGGLAKQGSGSRRSVWGPATLKAAADTRALYDPASSLSGRPVQLPHVGSIGARDASEER